MEPTEQIVPMYVNAKIMELVVLLMEFVTVSRDGLVINAARFAQIITMESTV